jgi:hypothetical protein
VPSSIYDGGITMKIEDDLREALQRGAGSAAPSSDAWDRIDRRRRERDQPSTQRRLGIILVAAAVAVGGIGVAIKAFDRDDASVLQSPAASVEPIGSVHTFNLGWDPSSEASYGIASRDGFAWVSGYHHLTLFGPNGAQSAADFKQGPFSLSSSSSATWAAGFEPGTGSYVTRFPLGSAVPDLTVPIPDDLSVSDVEATDADVWVFTYQRSGADGNLGTLLRVDPATGEMVKSVVLRDALPASVGNDPMVYATSADEGALWILTAEVVGGNLGKITLVRLDASTYATRVYDPGRVSAVVAGGGAVWLPAEHGAIRLDPDTGKTTVVDVPATNSSPFAASGSTAWYLGGTATQVDLVRLDVDGEGIHVGMDLQVQRRSAWGSVNASYDGAGTVWLLYESGPLQEVSVGT